MHWISSYGGPFVVIPRTIAEAWTGNSSDDYDIACGVVGFVGVIKKLGYEVFVLGDEPARTSIFETGGRSFIVRCLAANSESAIELACLSICGRLEDAADIEDVDERCSFVVSDPDFIIMDSVLDGACPEEKVLPFKLAEGRYEVRTYYFENDDVELLVHDFVEKP